MYEIQRGEILLDGVNIKEINIHDLRRKIGTILQDPSTIVNVDKIIVLDKGRIIEQGNHEELLQNPKGYYTKLYTSYYNSLETA